ncbi:ABC transporter permease [Canibacter sp. lx-72]|uniref:ABC transporter permease n=1 Tax=Canibacter zhuwentaonis TaxID=2837491 RepID=UPI001BDD76F7|nr:ABC transporter permease [Canibacter zhuwentaonis]MBT1017792.1 ABC transporter permease [Canibacter zhuwentaonis]
MVFLVSYVVYFLTGLSTGLAGSYSEAVEDWKADSIVLSESANYNIAASGITAAALKDIKTQEPGNEALEVSPVVVDAPGKDNTVKRISAYTFGIDFNSPLVPRLAEGDLPIKSNELVADVKFKQAGMKIGDPVVLPVPQAPDSKNVTWRISGFVNAKFQAAPTLFVSAAEFAQHLRAVRNPHIPEEQKVLANAVVLFKTPGDSLQKTAGDNDLEIIEPAKFIQNLPGFAPQQLTFNMMIGALIGILTLVLGIFVYVLTVQKRQIFGVMKAQGIATSYIVRSSVLQTLVLTVVGIALGFIATWLTSLAVGGVIPFKMDPLLYPLISLAFIVFSVVGALVPARMISKIDPIEAIS